jgi:hypothetical protein
MASKIGGVRLYPPATPHRFAAAEAFRVRSTIERITSKLQDQHLMFRTDRYAFLKPFATG